MIKTAAAALTIAAFLASGSAAQQVTTIKLSSPIHADGMVMTAAGDLLVSSAWEGTTIAKVDLPSGRVSEYADGLLGPISLAIRADGTVFSSNWRGESVSRVDTDGTVTEFATIGPKGDGLVFDSKGDLWVTQGSSNEIKKIAPDGTVTLVAAGGILDYPLGITISEDDTIFVGGGKTGEIYRLPPDTREPELFATVPGPGPWRIGHILYAKGRLFATGLASNRIFEIDMTGNVSVLAGSGELGRADGSGPEASFSFPVSLHLTADGTSLFVLSAASETDALRRISLE